MCQQMRLFRERVSHKQRSLAFLSLGKAQSAQEGLTVVIFWRARANLLTEYYKAMLNQMN